MSYTPQSHEAKPPTFDVLAGTVQDYVELGGKLLQEAMDATAGPSVPSGYVEQTVGVIDTALADLVAAREHLLHVPVHQAFELPNDQEGRQVLITEMLAAWVLRRQAADGSVDVSSRDFHGYLGEQKLLGAAAEAFGSLAATRAAVVRALGEHGITAEWQRIYPDENSVMTMLTGKPTRPDKSEEPVQEQESDEADALQVESSIEVTAEPPDLSELAAVIIIEENVTGDNLTHASLVAAFATSLGVDGATAEQTVAALLEQGELLSYEKDGVCYTTLPGLEEVPAPTETEATAYEVVDPAFDEEQLAIAESILAVLEPLSHADQYLELSVLVGKTANTKEETAFTKAMLERLQTRSIVHIRQAEARRKGTRKVVQWTSPAMRRQWLQERAKMVREFGQPLHKQED